MKQKIKNLLNIDNRFNLLNEKLQIIENQNLEIIWANVFHDSIRGYSEIEKLSLNIGRWAGSYPFFYILNRVLKDFRPKNILELGLGESTKFISTYLKHYLQNSNHVITEHDPCWIEIFDKNFKLSKNSKIIEFELEKKNIEGFDVISYSDFSNKFNTNFDFIVIDAPFGSPRFSRYDIVDYLKKCDFVDDFVIILDDTDRKGEKDTLKVILSLLQEKNKSIYIGTYVGVKSTTLISNLKYLTSL